jgi:hypothetical protein
MPCDALAERARRRPLGVAVLRMPVAGQGAEHDHVRVAHHALAGLEALTDGQSLEWV